MSSLPRDFNGLIKTSDKPVLVDFYADWCGPCKIVSPVIKRLAKEYSGRIITVKINVDKKPELATQFQARSIPTIMMFHKGAALFRLVGAHTYENIKNHLDKNL